jgi:hypothetical protein
MDSVKEANVVNGAYGIVAKVKAHTMDKLREVIASKVRRLSSVSLGRRPVSRMYLQNFNRRDLALPFSNE